MDVIKDRVEERAAVSGPRPAVVRPRDPIGEVLAGVQVPETKLVELVAAGVQRPGHQRAIRADLADADLAVRRPHRGRLGVQVEHRHPVPGRRGHPLELPELSPLDDHVPELGSRHRMRGALLSDRGPGDHLGEQVTPHRLHPGRSGQVVVGFGAQVRAEVLAPLGHPGQVIGDVPAMQVPDERAPGRLGRCDHGRRT